MSTPGLIPDGQNWVDAYGRTWTANGDDLLLWAYPEIVLLGDNPQKIVQGSTYQEAGATASDVTGADLSGSIVIDASGLDVNVPGSYLVAYTVLDSEGYETKVNRTVIVLDVDRPDVRDMTAQLLEDGLPDGMTVDAEGYIWSAHWDGSCVIRYAPDGREERRIHFPAKQVSSVTFGGADYTDLYVTTAGGTEKEKQGPGAGALFHVNPGIQGLPEFPSRIGL